jgi:hypothetical protein
MSQAFQDHFSGEGDSVNDFVHDFYENIVGPYWPPECALVEKGYRTIPFPFVEIAPPAFRMETCWTLDQLLGYFSTWSATNRFMRATGRNPLDPLEARLARAWGDRNSPRPVNWPLAMRVGRRGN